MQSCYSCCSRKFKSFSLIACYETKRVGQWKQTLLQNICFICHADVYFCIVKDTLYICQNLLRTIIKQINVWCSSMQAFRYLLWGGWDVGYFSVVGIMIIIIIVVVVVDVVVLTMNVVLVAFSLQTSKYLNQREHLLSKSSPWWRWRYPGPWSQWMVRSAWTRRAAAATSPRAWMASTKSDLFSGNNLAMVHTTQARLFISFKSRKTQINSLHQTLYSTV